MKTVSSTRLALNQRDRISTIRAEAYRRLKYYNGMYDFRKQDVHALNVLKQSVMTRKKLSYKHHLDPSTSTDRPTLSQLRELFVASAIPMVGFGFMDNFIMIQAGGYIDATLGVKMGLATMTAAAMGQVVSDVSGVLFGGTLERGLHCLGIAKAPNLSITQRQLPISRNISMLGAVFGVMIGCGLGASSLLLRDLEAHEEMPEDNNLASILDSIIQDNKIDADCCTIFLTDQNLAREISGDVKSFAVRVISEIETDTAVQKSLNDRAVVTDTIDVQTTHLVESLKFHSILCAPIHSSNKEVIGVVQFSRNGISKNRNFSTQDEVIAQVMAKSVGAVINALSNA